MGALTSSIIASHALARSSIGGERLRLTATRSGDSGRASRCFQLGEICPCACPECGEPRPNGDDDGDIGDVGANLGEVGLECWCNGKGIRISALAASSSSQDMMEAGDRSGEGDTLGLGDDRVFCCRARMASRAARGESLRPAWASDEAVEMFVATELDVSNRSRDEVV